MVCSNALNEELLISPLSAPNYEVTVRFACDEQLSLNLVVVPVFSPQFAQYQAEVPVLCSCLESNVLGAERTLYLKQTIATASAGNKAIGRCPQKRISRVDLKPGLLQLEVCMPLALQLHVALSCSLLIVTSPPEKQRMHTVSPKKARLLTASSLQLG